VIPIKRIGPKNRNPVKLTAVFANGMSMVALPASRFWSGAANVKREKKLSPTSVNITRRIVIDASSCLLAAIPSFRKGFGTSAQSHERGGKFLNLSQSLETWLAILTS